MSEKPEDTHFGHTIAARPDNMETRQDVEQAKAYFQQSQCDANPKNADHEAVQEDVRCRLTKEMSMDDPSRAVSQAQKSRLSSNKQQSGKMPR